MRLTQHDKGYWIPNIFAFIALGFTRLGIYYFGENRGHLDGNSGTLIFSEFIVVPVLMGIISAWYGKKTIQVDGHLSRVRRSTQFTR